ncbi:response regulator transcription factor [Allofournierella sp.]|uniref:response regulator transcription factor n=1 Tax=Allofournierella sp. TaxID=1940256 RepID=UPI003AB8B3BC
MRILMIEDDRDLCAAVAAGLAREGWQLDACHDGEAGLCYLKEGVYDVCLLDRMLPGLDGLQLLRAARAAGVSTPVLLLTALGAVHDKVDGLDAGADDYLAKPFDLRELAARVRALARRPGAPACKGPVCFGDLALDASQLLLTGPGGSAGLSRRECELLEALIRGGGQLLPRGLLLGKVWGPYSEVEDANLDSYIHFVRRRLLAVKARTLLVTVRGVGYRLEAPRA